MVGLTKFATDPFDGSIATGKNLRDVTNMTVLCEKSDLIANAGVCALHNGEQIALYYLPDHKPSVYALNNWDPLGKANVLSRGIIGDVQGQAVVASPLYKQHFELSSGQCLEDEDAKVKTYDVALVDEGSDTSEDRKS